MIVARRRGRWLQGVNEDAEAIARQMGVPLVCGRSVTEGPFRIEQNLCAVPGHDNQYYSPELILRGPSVFASDIQRAVTANALPTSVLPVLPAPQLPALPAPAPAPAPSAQPAPAAATTTTTAEPEVEIFGYQIPRKWALIGGGGALLLFLLGGRR